MRVKASIIIPVWNAPQLTEQTLRSLAKFWPDPDKCLCEVVIVDNGSDAPTKAMLAAVDYLPAKVITNPVNRGFPEACNQGAAVARGDTLIFLNSDVVSDGPWVRTLWREVTCADHDLARLNKNVGQAGPEMVWWPMGKNFGNRKSPYVNGWCMAIRKAVFDWIGGFDRAYSPAYSEDRDLGYRLYIAGLDLKQVSLPLRHVGNGTVNQNGFNGGAAQQHGLQVFEGKWGAAPFRRIAIIRCWAVGDVVMGHAACGGVRRRWPNAHIAFVTDPPMVPLIASTPYADEILVREGGAETRLAQDGQWDLVVQIQDLRPNHKMPEVERAENKHPDGELEVFKIARAKAKRLWWQVVDAEDGSDPLGVQDLTCTNTGWHVVETYCRTIGENCQPWWSYVNVNDEALKDVLDTLGVHPRPWIVVGPTGGWKSKRWPERAALRVIERLHRRRIASVMVIGMEEEYALPDGVIDLRRRTPLPRLIALLSQADCVLCGDTGFAHIANALNTPVISHWGPTRPDCYHPVGRGPQYMMLGCAPCSPCNKPECRIMGTSNRMPCIEDIDTELVVDLVREALSRGPNVDPKLWRMDLQNPVGERKRE